MTLVPYTVTSSILIQILTISNTAFNIATLLHSKLGSMFEFAITGMPTRGNGSTNNPHYVSETYICDLMTPMGMAHKKNT
jgi:hypothetical protein